MPPGSGLKVPASISLARKVRTSSRRAWHSGGRRIGSKVSSVAMSVSSSSRQHGPQAIGALRRDDLPKLDGPGALVAEIVAPGPQAAREAVQCVLLREADGAQDLVGDACPLRGGLADADLGGGGFEEHGLVEGRRIGDGVGGRA